MCVHFAKALLKVHKHLAIALSNPVIIPSFPKIMQANDPTMIQPYGVTNIFNKKTQASNVCEKRERPLLICIRVPGLFSCSGLPPRDNEKNETSNPTWPIAAHVQHESWKRDFQVHETPPREQWSSLTKRMNLPSSTNADFLEMNGNFRLLLGWKQNDETWSKSMETWRYLFS